MTKQVVLNVDEIDFALKTRKQKNKNAWSGRKNNRNLESWRNWILHFLPNMLKGKKKIDLGWMIHIGNQLYEITSRRFDP